MSPSRRFTLIVLSAIVSLLGVSVMRAAVVSPATLPVPAFAGVESFEVVGIDGERARNVALHAAELRRRISTELLGVAMPVAWTPRCLIRVHLTEESFAEAVGGAPSSARGATSIEFCGDSVGLRRIDLMVDLPDQGIPDALGHELVHVILADRFIEQPPPRWADEGLAMLYDSEEKQRGHDEDFREAALHGMAWSGVDMFDIELDAADIARERVFYGESLALVRWFLTQGSPSTFLSFIEDCDEKGLAGALQHHYGIGSLVEFDSRWDSVLTASR
jgi:hypothetical protein